MDVIKSVEKLDLNDGDVVVLNVEDGFEIAPDTMGSIYEWSRANDKHMLILPEGMKVEVKTAQDIIEQLQKVVDDAD